LVAPALLLCSVITAGAAASTWSVTNAFPGLTFDDALYLTPAPGTSRLYVSGREGVIWSFQNDPNTTNKTVFLDISARTQGWESCGLLGMAFHPDFGKAGSTNRGYFYVYYSYSANPLPGPNAPPLTTPTYNRLSRFTVPDGSLVADPNSEVVLVNQYDLHIWHNGGAVFFGADGFLYFTNGDEGGGNDQYNVAQTLTGGLFAGLFRIDVNRDPSKSHPIRRQPVSGGTGSPPSSSANYYIPNDNPFLDPNGGVLEEYWALGFRSPHRATFDAATGLIMMGDVGQDSYEEVDIVQKGGNYQWAYREGFHVGPKPMPSPLIGTDSPPIYEYPHDAGNNCVIGGYLYRGQLYAAALGGQYIFGDNGSGRVWAMTFAGVNPPIVTQLCTMPGSLFTGLSSFGLDEKGEIYMCKMGLGQPLYKLVGTAGPPPPPSSNWTNQDIGLVGLAGSSSFTNGVFTIAGSGADIWDTSDGFQFNYQTWTGDGELVARVTGVQPTDGWAKAGVMFRETLDAGSRHAMMLVSAAEGIGFERRLAANGVTTWTQGALVIAPYWLRLVRIGSTFTAYGSADGVNWTPAGSDTIPMTANLYVGLAVTSHNNNLLNTSTFDNVSLTGPVPSLTLARFDTQGRMLVGISGELGRVYSLQVSPDLRIWSNISTFTNQGSLASFLDNQTTNQPRRFYRALLQN
jgi:glucose/arabinose dehydrogenase